MDKGVAKMRCQECFVQVHINFPFGRRSSPRIVGRHTPKCKGKNSNVEVFKIKKWFGRSVSK